MVIVAVVVVIVVVVAVVKVLVWAAAVIDMGVVVEALAINVLADVEPIVMGVIMIVLKFASPVPYSVDVPSSDADVDSFKDALAEATLRALTGIGIEVLADASANVLAVVMAALEFPVSAPLEDFSR